jgi:uncharacterized protein (UPF0333 family)
MLLFVIGVMLIYLGISTYHVGEQESLSAMACACKNKSSNNAQVTKVKQVVKSKNVTPTASATSDAPKKATRRVIYRRSV